MAKFKKKGTAHAHTRRAQKAPVRFKDLPENKKRKYIGLSILAAVLLIALIVVYKTELISYLGGRVRFQDGALKGVEANDFVINREKSKYGADGKYYVIGSLDIPEGYTDYPEMLNKNDAYRQSFSYKIVDTPEVIESVVFQACTDDYENLIRFVMGEDSESVDYSERYDRVSPNKKNAYHGAMQTHITRNEENGYYYKHAYAYVETGVKDACVMIQLTSKTAYKKDLPSDEMYLAKLEEMVERVNAVE